MFHKVCRIPIEWGPQKTPPHDFQWLQGESSTMGVPCNTEPSKLSVSRLPISHIGTRMTYSFLNDLPRLILPVLCERVPSSDLCGLLLGPASCKFDVGELVVRMKDC